ncbi:MAG: nucleotidyltransferase domain-containing protein [Oscillochloridaceae bacterium]|nr:nucleotidyltransferase domain-containing protein [Chloroflexaceae bacterium]MDW8388809.1 nucleotidyltransferase domain-containing protein [Oscillochloridaceae bacterium]
MTIHVRLNLPARYLDQVRAILRQYAPACDVWAYGSRVTGGAHEASDLDLVVRNPHDLQRPFERLFELREAFVESNLPIHVDVMDWARLPPTFRQEIERSYVVVQAAEEGGDGEVGNVHT